MTDIYCFTCSHEIRQNFVGGWAHIDDDDLRDCVCVRDGLRCEP